MNQEKKRLQFDFSAEAIAELNELQSATGLATRAELIRHALRFLQWGLEETGEGGATLLVEKNGKIREVVFPFWRRNTPHADADLVAEHDAPTLSYANAK